MFDQDVAPLLSSYNPFSNTLLAPASCTSAGFFGLFTLRSSTYSFSSSICFSYSQRVSFFFHRSVFLRIGSRVAVNVAVPAAVLSYVASDERAVCPLRRAASPPIHSRIYIWRINLAAWECSHPGDDVYGQNPFMDVGRGLGSASIREYDVAFYKAVKRAVISRNLEREARRARYIMGGATNQHSAANLPLVCNF